MKRTFLPLLIILVTIVGFSSALIILTSVAEPNEESSSRSVLGQPEVVQGVSHEMLEPADDQSPEISPSASDSSEANQNIMMNDEDISLVEPTSLFNETLERYDEIGYVKYVKLVGSIPERIELWESWVEAYQKGEPAKVLLYLDGMSFPDGLYELICDGTDTFEIRCHIKKNNDVEIYYSDYILMNDFQYIFAPEINRMSSNSRLFYKPIDREPIEYDVTMLPVLGETTPQAAIEIAKAQLTEYNRDIVEAVPYSLSVVDAQRLYGKNFYILESASETLSTFNERWHGTIAINADGGNQVLMTGGMDDSLPLIYDSNMVKIQGEKTTIVPYRDQRTW